MHFTLDQAREIVNVLDNITSKPEYENLIQLFIGEELKTNFKHEDFYHLSSRC